MPKKPLFKKTERAYMIIITIGLLLIGAGSLFDGFESLSHLFEFGGGFGCAMIFVGTVGVFRLRQNPKLVKQQDVDENDERNIQIREKSAYSSFFITILTLVVVVVVFVILQNVVAVITINIIMAVHVLSYLVLLRINNKRM